MKLGYCQKYQCAVAGARRCRGGVFFRGDHRTRLQAVSVFVLNGVLLVLEHAVQRLVKMRHVIAAVEIVIHEYFPVAVQTIRATLKEVN